MQSRRVLDAVLLRCASQSNLSTISAHEHGCTGQGFRNGSNCINCIGSGWNLLFTVCPPERFFAPSRAETTSAKRVGGQIGVITLRLSRSQKCEKRSGETAEGNAWRGRHALEYVVCAILISQPKWGECTK